MIAPRNITQLSNGVRLVEFLPQTGAAYEILSVEACDAQCAWEKFGQAQAAASEGGAGQILLELVVDEQVVNECWLTAGTAPAVCAVLDRTFISTLSH